MIKDLSLKPTFAIFPYVIRLGVCIMASLFIALCAQIVIPFYPIPMTMQPFAVLLLALALPTRLSLGALFLYLTEAALGLPFLTGGVSGIAPFMGPTAGYLLGYIVMASLISSFYPRAKNIPMKFVVVTLGYSSLFACGAMVLSFFVGLEKAIISGVIPFLLKDMLQGVLAMLLAYFLQPSLQKMLEKNLK